MTPGEATLNTYTLMNVLEHTLHLYGLNWVSMAKCVSNSYLGKARQYAAVNLTCTRMPSEMVASLVPSGAMPAMIPTQFALSASIHTIGHDN